MQVRCTFPQWQAGLPECIDANAPTGRPSLNGWRGMQLTADGELALDNRKSADGVLFREISK